MTLTSYIVPCLLLLAAACALRRGVDVYDALITGASNGVGIVARILPSMVALLCAVSMLRASGAMDLLTNLLSPLCRLLGIPPETVPLVVIRPISGSAALAVGTELMATHGVDSLIGRTAAIMLGSTETTFYAISVYFGAAGIKKTRYTIPAALIADFTGFLTASLAAKFL